MTLENALREMESEYEFDRRMTYDTLQDLKIMAKLELVRDLLSRLAPELPGEDKP